MDPASQSILIFPKHLTWSLITNSYRNWLLSILTPISWCFLKSYLNQRSQTVYVNGCLSDSAKITSGIPQGSVLGPLLLLIFINDLPKTAQTSSSYLFADDSKLHSVLTTSDMQHDINCFLYWSGENLMRFNIDKCNVISFKNRESIGSFFLDGNELPVVNTIKDLGIMVSDGKWSFRLMPFRLKSFRLTCLVTSPNFFRRNVFYFGHFA